MKKLTSLLLIALLLLCAAGTAYAEEDPNLGVYTGTTAEYSGITLSLETFFENGFSIELKENGKCILNADGVQASGTWTLEGTAFTVTGGGLDCSGTLENGLMRLEYEGVIFNLVNEAYAGPAAPEAPAAAATESNGGGEPQAEAELRFTNQTGATLYYIYISNDPEEWGESLLGDDDYLHTEEELLLDFADIGGEPGLYDVGVVDANRVNYDIYDVTLGVGDSMVLLPASDDTATLLVIQANKETKLYTGKSYLGKSAASADALMAALEGSWAHGSSYVYEFRTDGTGVYHVGTTDMDFTYTLTGEEISFLFTGNTAPMVLQYRIEGSTLILVDSFGRDVDYIKQ